MVKELLLIPFLVFACIYTVHGQFMNGVSSYFKTPNGNSICDGTEVSDYINAPVGKLDKWYFYKDRIIGIGDSGYFILDEVNSLDRLYTTYSETEWSAEIERRDLSPYFGLNGTPWKMVTGENAILQNLIDIGFFILSQE
ncbi:hypothetical protein CLV58_101112 [Spirosoma oryzae]|uniref:Uncharacterized protein n=1 Tax=Spirosoma oryzae TaxID=1469603 RepID=A0A2T0TNE3_9BACT|nr:hypothetical protein [Spirosoma oryzae]PRY47048.1 hypothetical protein CLV58_101112 [Spirosoma oryzae]